MPSLPRFRSGQGRQHRANRPPVQRTTHRHIHVYQSRYRCCCHRISAKMRSLFRKKFEHADLHSTLVRAVMSETIGERHASACRYKNEVPEGSRRSARRTHFWPPEVESQHRPQKNFTQAISHDRKSGDSESPCCHSWRRHSGRSKEERATRRRWTPRATSRLVTTSGTPAPTLLYAVDVPAQS